MDLKQQNPRDTARLSARVLEPRTATEREHFAFQGGLLDFYTTDL